MSNATDTKQFPLHAALMATTGHVIIKDGFHAFHELAEHIMGHPIWSHEFGMKATASAVKQAARALLPDLPTEIPPCPDGADYAVVLADWLGEVEAIHGATVDVPKGGVRRTVDPISTAVEIMSGVNGGQE